MSRTKKLWTDVVVCLSVLVLVIRKGQILLLEWLRLSWLSSVALYK